MVASVRHLVAAMLENCTVCQTVWFIGGILENASHSIGTKRDIYGGAMKWAHSFGNANIPGVSFP